MKKLTVINGLDAICKIAVMLALVSFIITMHASASV